MVKLKFFSSALSTKEVISALSAASVNVPNLRMVRLPLLL